MEVSGIKGITGSIGFEDNYGISKPAYSKYYTSRNYQTETHKLTQTYSSLCLNRKHYELLRELSSPMAGKTAQRNSFLAHFICRKRVSGGKRLNLHGCVVK